MANHVRNFAFLRLISFLAIIIDRCSTQSLSKKCEDIRDNVAANPGSSKSRLLPDCLFKFLKDKAAKEANDNAYALTSFEPPHTDAGPFPVKISSLYFTDVNYILLMTESAFVILLKGSVELSWTDSRLSWNKLEWNADKILLNRGKNIWMPHLDKQTKIGVKGSFKNGRINHNGTVNVELASNIMAKCYEFPGEIVPQERRACCAKFSAINARFVLDQAQKTRIDLAAHIRTRLFDSVFVGGAAGSHVPEIYKPLISEDETKELHFCTKMNSKSQLQINRYVLPIFGFGMILIASQLFHNMLSQLGIKLFSFLLQFLGFIKMFPRSWDRTETMPAVYSAYYITFVVSLISILLTTISMRLASIDYESAPPHFLQLLVNAASKYIAFGGKFGYADQDDIDARSDSWNRCITLFHNLICILMHVIYCVVLIGLFM